MKGLEALELLSSQLATAASIHEQIALLDQYPPVQKFLSDKSYLRTFFAGLSPDCESALKQMAAIEQSERFFEGVDPSNLQIDRLRELVDKLREIDHFYRELGGIVGYQTKILALLEGRKNAEPPTGLLYHPPHFFDLSEERQEVAEAICWGIEALPQMAEMYPLGGAADRLHLLDEKTGAELPAAKLCFAGRTLLEHLIRDLQAREYLYFKMYGRQLVTPIAIMTSHEKGNHFHVERICAEANWFGRPKGAFRFFIQPLVPAVNESGNWCRLGPLKPVLKPGGHGAIWKLARDEGIFSWFEEEGRNKALIRQINNPLAGLDYGLIAFSGIGCKKEMLFGFASCPRLLQAAEGVNVLIEKKTETGSECVITNIEYCDFAKFGIEDLPLKEGGSYSRFSSNTNILFVDLKAIRQAIDSSPFPGLLMNMKKGSYTTEAGEKKEESMGRLESTMQNIADVFVERIAPLSPCKTEKTFVTYNKRHKTISTTKKAFVPGKPLQETPENCFYDLLVAHRELLKECGFSLPSERKIEEYLEKGPEFLFLYHPALGPLYSLIRKKIRGGKLALGSELLLEIAEIDAVDLQVEGSLQVIAEQSIGSLDQNGLLRYSSRIGSCRLEKVSIANRGIDWSLSKPAWKMEISRFESVKIILKGRSQFTAQNVRIVGDHTWVVEEGKEMRVSEKNGKLVVEERTLRE